MELKKALIAAAASVAVVVGALTAVAAVEPASDMMEKCFGVAKAGQKGDGHENGGVFVNLPKGKCEMLQGGSLKPATEAPKL